MNDFYNKYKDLFKRIFFTLGALIVFRIGAQVPVPGIDPFVIKSFVKASFGSFTSILDIVSGGSMSQFTVFAFGVMPYINASIFVQLLTLVDPKYEEMSRDDGGGKEKLASYVKYLTVFLALGWALFNSFRIMSFSEGGRSAVYISYFPFISVPVWLSGVLFLVWLGKQIDTRGIKGGTSWIILANILSGVPSGTINLFTLGRRGDISLTTVLSFITLLFVLLLLVVVVEKTYRMITIHYPQLRFESSSIASMHSIDGHSLPIKLNIGGIMPSIMAYTIISLPAEGTFIHSTIIWIVRKISFLNDLRQYPWVYGWITLKHPLNTLLLVVCLISLTFWYVGVQFKPERLADDLKRSGAVILGIRPGLQTAQHLEYVVNRVTCVGALYLVFICIVPDLILNWISAPIVRLGGTSVLIVVSTITEGFSQIRSYLISNRYRGIVRGRK